MWLHFHSKYTLYKCLLLEAVQKGAIHKFSRMCICSQKHGQANSETDASGHTCTASAQGAMDAHLTAFL